MPISLFFFLAIRMPPKLIGSVKLAQVAKIVVTFYIIGGKLKGHTVTRNNVKEL